MPFYVFLGPELGEKQEAFKNILGECTRHLKTQNVGVQWEQKTFFIDKANAPDLLLDLETTPLFATHRAFLVYQTENLKNLPKSLLQRFFAIKDPKTYVFLLSSEHQLPFLYPFKEFYHERVFWEFFESQKRQWIQSFFQKRNKNINLEAVDYLLKHWQGSTQNLRSQLNLVFDELKDKTVTPRTLAPYIFSEETEDSFSFFILILKGFLEPVLIALFEFEQVKLSYPELVDHLIYHFYQLRSYQYLRNKRDSKTLRKELRLSYRRENFLLSYAQLSDLQLEKSLDLLHQIANRLRKSPVLGHPLEMQHLCYQLSRLF